MQQLPEQAPEPSGREQKTSRKRIIVRERDAKALMLKVAGSTEGEIAVALGVSKSTAHEAWNRALKAVPVPAAQELRMLCWTRLEKLYAAQAPAAYRGDAQAGEQCRKVIADYRKLFGLDAPQEITGADGGPVRFEVRMVEAAAKVTAKLDELAKRRIAREATEEAQEA